MVNPKRNKVVDRPNELDDEAYPIWVRPPAAFLVKHQDWVYQGRWDGLFHFAKKVQGKGYLPCALSMADMLSNNGDRIMEKQLTRLLKK